MTAASEASPPSERLRSVAPPAWPHRSSHLNATRRSSCRPHVVPRRLIGLTTTRACQRCPPGCAAPPPAAWRTTRGTSSAKWGAWPASSRSSTASGSSLGPVAAPPGRRKRGCLRLPLHQVTAAPLLAVLSLRPASLCCVIMFAFTWLKFFTNGLSFFFLLLLTLLIAFCFLLRSKFTMPKISQAKCEVSKFLVANQMTAKIIVRQIFCLSYFGSHPYRPLITPFSKLFTR